MEFIRQIDDNTREVYRFTKIDDNVCFTFFALETKPKGKRKWSCDQVWDNYNKRACTIDEPEIPESIVDEALMYYQKQLRVVRFSERYKKS